MRRSPKKAFSCPSCPEWLKWARLVGVKMGKEMNAPEPFGAIIDGVSAMDREYFEANPGQSSYVRGMVPGEFWPYNIDLPYVKVTSMEDGVRTREPCMAACSN